MAAPRLTTLAIKGLVTTPNEYGVYPEGSCSDLVNLRSLSANQWELARDLGEVITSGANTLIPYRVVGISPGVFFVVYADKATYTTWAVYLNGDSSASFTLTSPLSFSNLFDGNGYLNSFVKRTRCFLNSKQGVLVLEDLNPSGAPQRVFRSAGLPQPTLDLPSPSAGDVLPDGVTVTYSALIRRVTADGYVMVSTPTLPLRFVNDLGSSQQVSISVRWAYATDFQAGDVLELYRSAGIASIDFSTDTGTSMRLVGVSTLTSSDVSSRVAVVNDLQPMVGPLYETDGAEIYTSPYQEGSTGANLPPPVCKAMAQWGSYTFYGNITDEPSWVMDVPGGFISDGSAAWSREYGIGARLTTGTRTAGSPTITGVSAADMIGVAVGQWWGSGAGFANGTQVISVGATTITMSANSSATSSAAFYLADVLEINGVSKAVYSMTDFITQVGTYLGNDLAVFPSETVASPGSLAVTYVVGTSLLLRPKRAGRWDAVYGSTLQVRGTNGQNYSPPIPEITASARVISRVERPNFFRWSKQNQPEAVPSSNEGIIGAGEIIRFLPTTDCLWALCTDGAYRISGEAGVWRADLVDPTFVPVAPDACCVLNDVVYAYTPRGFSSLAGVQTSLLSRGVIDSLFPVRQFQATRGVQLYAYPATEEILTIFPNATPGLETTVLLYSSLYKQWSRLQPSASRRGITCAGTFYPSDPSQRPYVLFGMYSNTPFVNFWSVGDFGSFLPGYVQLQPFYGGDPLKMKRWIDATWLLPAPPSAAFPATVAQYVNGEYSGEAVNTSMNGLDGRASIGINASAARAPSLALSAYITTGYTGTAAIPKLKGVSIRYAGPITTQQRSR